ncbi:MAG: RNA pseudouridine synthase, partial [Actinobacteria bacterium]|nr:RNA pseudouridine synthase [Actinomycetota bacterium]
MTQPQRLVARSQDEGVRLDVFLADHLQVSRTRAQKAIAADGVRVDGRARTKHHVVQAGEVVEVDLTVVAEPA